MLERQFDGEYFDPAATLSCGQTFRWSENGGGWLVLSGGRACRLFKRENKTVLFCRAEDMEYFVRYFDCSRDYAPIAARAAASGFPAAKEAVQFGKGIRILNQDPAETVFSFILSQNNHIPRIKSIIGRMCAALGEKREFDGQPYCTFPKTEVLAQKDEAFYVSLGCGYRAKYIAETARILARESMEKLSALPTPALRETLIALPGIGPKVADCILLFGFHRTDAFPVDTWIEKVYREQFGGTLKDRNKISAFFADTFGEFGGYVQQYLFYYAREHGGAPSDK